MLNFFNNLGTMVYFSRAVNCSIFIVVLLSVNHSSWFRGELKLLRCSSCVTICVTTSFSTCGSISCVQCVQERMLVRRVWMGLSRSQNVEQRFPKERRSEK